MEKLIGFYKEISSRRQFDNIRLGIDHGPVTDWAIQIRVGLEGEIIFYEQDIDIDLLAAKAQVAFKKWLCENNGGY